MQVHTYYNDAVDEYVDREHHKKNLIVHNLLEPTVGKTDEQHTPGDLQAISGLLVSEFGVSASQVSKPRSKKSNKPQLLRIEISDVNVKRSILKKATKCAPILHIVTFTFLQILHARNGNKVKP